MAKFGDFIPDPATLSTDEKINAIFTVMMELKNNNLRMQETINTHVKEIASLHNTVNSLNKEVYDLKNTVNNREQDCRSLNIRIIGVPYSEEEKAATDNKLLCKKVYDRILVPILTSAKAANIIDKIPSISNTIADCYRIGPLRIPGTGNPPHIILRFVDSTTRLAILKTKKTSTPKPNTTERDMGITRFIINEDLTPATYKKMLELKTQEEVEKVWTVEGRIRYTISGSSTVRKVRSSFDSIDTILSGAPK